MTRLAIAESAQEIGNRSAGTNTRSRRRPLLPLTGLRFVAALMVVCCHFAPYRRAPGPQSALDAIANTGFTAVTLFFILSGFILTYTYWDASNLGRIDRRAFWFARCSRIYPVYLLGLGLAVVPYLWGHDPRATPLVTGMSAPVLVQAWLPWSCLAWNPPGWSLSAEAFFYLLFPSVLPLIGRLSRRNLCAVLVLMFLLNLLVPLTYMLLNPDGLRTTWGVDAYWLHVTHFNPLLRLPQFVVGVILGRFFLLNSKTVSRLTNDVQGVGVSDHWALLSIFAAICLVAVHLLGQSIPTPFFYSGLVDPLYALLIYSLAWNQGVLARILSLRAAVMLGEASFALYILHYPLWQWMVYLLRVPEHPIAYTSPFFVTYLALAVAVSLLTLRCVERPARLILLSLTHSR